MSDEDVKPEVPEPEGERNISPEPRLVRQEADWFLQLLVNMANEGLEFHLTLQVGGFLVSGKTVSVENYFKIFADDFVKGEDIAGFKETFTQLGAFPKDMGEQILPPPNYIHLTDARYYHHSGNPIPDNQGILWRGRLSEVGGFYLGGLIHQRSS